MPKDKMGEASAVDEIQVEEQTGDTGAVVEG